MMRIKYSGQRFFTSCSVKRNWYCEFTMLYMVLVLPCKMCYYVIKHSKFNLLVIIDDTSPFKAHMLYFYGCIS